MESLNDFTKIVFKIIGTMVLSLLLYKAVFGIPGRTIMWRGIGSACEKNWQMLTYQDGYLLNDALSKSFDTLHDQSTN